MTTDSSQWVHMVGVAGAGMSGIARVLKEQGIKVSGSDLQNNEITKKLTDIGVEIKQGHSSAYLQEGVDLLVISSAIPEDNVEVQEARRRGIPVLKRGEILARLANASKGIAIAGAHGKTTTTSMLYTVLEACGLDPTFIVGGEIQGSELNARLGQGEYFVVEADESDASFLELRPFISVVTNIENDHLDFYKSFDRIKKAFEQFLDQVDPDGFALIYGADQCLQEIQRNLSGRVITYGEDSRFDYCLKNWQVQGMGSSFDVYRHQDFLGKIELLVPGRHNALNALAAVAVAFELGYSFQSAAAGLSNFQGAKRRFQVLGTLEGRSMVVDDYAHHPTEIKATISAAQSLNYDRVVVVFQPHRYSRTGLLAEQFGACFKEADLVIISDVYSAGEKPINGVSGELIYQMARKVGCNALYIPTLDDIESFLHQEIRDNDLLITMGAGDIWKLGVKLVNNYSPSKL
ncbi:UDP-N-acetylmuramate-alanine ligase [Syntrophomonas zehnderi OL-4]|uniref:UDP-N-acetylmuramate--L-alanine ligase n=1 Tax=Syntrophomonas zehnderi OL-4 TaxID=690567 RepID=A0A0E4GBB9_9FIRM|nr:UDP-N-acetylmuramate--L-alanine ligase [Syntrophomonas zehnderi]CFX63069.1 UDP-N-acetylmuramate-alanine ligase [Syntrophomonas zehnderi OL-4]